MPTDSPATRIAVLETKVTSINENIGEIRIGLASIQTTLESKTLPVDSLTWKLVIALFAVIGTLVSLYTLWNSSKITGAETKADNVQKSLTEGLKGVDEKFVRLETKFDGRLKDIHEELKEFIKPFIKTSEDVAATTKRALSAPIAKLRHTLPAAESVLTIAKEKGIPLKPTQIKEIAQPIREHKLKDPVEAKKVDNMLSSLASYRSFSDSKLQRLPQHIIDTAKARKLFHENEQVQLGAQQVWEDVVFKDCEIVTGGGSSKLILKNVSFVNCTFRQGDGVDLAGDRLNAAVIDSPSPTISAVLYDFPVPKKSTGS